MMSTYLIRVCLQGVELNNIITDLVITDDGTSWHPVIRITDRLKTVDISDVEILQKLLSELLSECAKGLPYRVMCATEASGFDVLMDIYSRMETSDLESVVALLKTFCAFLNGQPDLVTETAMDLFLANCKSDSVELCLYSVRLIRYSCIMHEGNRQAFVGKAHLSSQYYFMSNV